MPDIATQWAGIIVRVKATDSKAFPGLVTSALNKINSKPVGQSLLNAIAAEAGKAKFGYTVCIMPKPSQKKTFGPLISWRKYERGSVTTAGDLAKAEIPGAGAISAVKWDPKSEQTPDGSRPPFIALAHELIHCMHNLLGTAHTTGLGATRKDEMLVVGLKGYEQFPITENRIRKEHGVRYRSKYDGVCGAEDEPDFGLLNQTIANA